MALMSLQLGSLRYMSDFWGRSDFTSLGGGALFIDFNLPSIISAPPVISNWASPGPIHNVEISGLSPYAVRCLRFQGSDHKWPDL
jgi:hypothetical protein